MTGPYRFLFDECLSTALVGVANSLGFEASHVNYLGRRGFSDRAQAVHAFDTDSVFATNNANDFRLIYRQFELHPGLIIILPSVRPAAQAELFTIAVSRLQDEPNAINKMIEVDRLGVVTIVDWSLDP